ncbi:MAG: aldo/keto reductase [Planctomycetota bacterium]
MIESAGQKTGMQYARIPGIATEVSRVAFGCMSTVSNQMYAGLEEAEAVSTMRHAFDLGVNFFDTARAYNDGESESQLGKAVAPFRDSVVIASKPKAGDLSEAEIISECEHSLKSLGTDRIDLYQIHWPKRVVALDETAKAMEKLVAQGKVVTIGVCNFGPQDLSEWLESTSCVTDQIAYSLIARGAELGVQETCVERGVGILCYSPLGQGLLAGRYTTADDVPSGKARTRHFSKDRPEARHTEDGCEQETFDAIRTINSIAERLGHTPAEVSLAWLLRQPAVTSVLCGASRPDQVERNVKAAEIRLSDDDVAALSAATDTVKAKMGDSLDMWASPPRTR